MLPISHLLTFAAIVAVIVAIPGPSVIFTVTRALTAGRRTALLSVTGNAAGVYLQVVAVAFGMAAVIQRAAAVLVVVAWVAGAYLVYLGVQAIRHRRRLPEALAVRTGPVSPARAVRDGFAVGATNPKTIAFFLVALPRFATPAAGHLPLQMMLLGTAFPAIALVLDSGWALAAGAARVWLARSPRRLALVGGAGGLAMIGLGVGLAVGGGRPK